MPSRGGASSARTKLRGLWSIIAMNQAKSVGWFVAPATLPSGILRMTRHGSSLSPSTFGGEGTSGTPSGAILDRGRLPVRAPATPTPRCCRKGQTRQPLACLPLLPGRASSGADVASGPMRYW